MRRLPIDTTHITFSVAEAPRQLTDFNTKAVKTTEGGLVLSSLRLLCQSPEEVAVIPVTVPGLAGEFKIGDVVTVKGLTAEPWANKSGALVERFTATSIEVASKTGKVAA